MHASVILHVPPDQLLAVLAPVGDDPSMRKGLNGDAVRVRALDDCAQIDLGVPLSDEPLLLFARVTAIVGDAMVALHADARGIPAFPTSYVVAATTWQAAREELGEAAEWLPLELGGGAMQMPDLSNLAAMFGSEGADIAARLQGPQGAELMESAMAMAQKLMAGGGLEQLLGGLGGGALDLNALKGQAENMLEQNPELQRQLEAQFGGRLVPPPDDDPDEST